MVDVICVSCHKRYPEIGARYRCPNCGGIFDWAGLPDYGVEADRGLPGIWRYKQTFPLSEDAPMITLGEGNTPLILDEMYGSRIAFKLEYLNPTGSYKDRGSAVLLSFLRSRGVGLAVEDSSGNAGASFAAYAARAGIKSRIYVPEDASGPKKTHIELSGAELVSVPGPRAAAAEAAKIDADRGMPYASHAFLPFGMFGIATIAYELCEQMETLPGTIVSPVGHGSLLLGVIRGFATLKKAGVISRVPTFIGVQSGACAPVWAAFHKTENQDWENQTIAEGIRVKDPVRGTSLCHEMTGKNDRMIVVGEKEIMPGRDLLAKRGLYVEPTSAIVVNALEQITGKVPEPIVLLLTGSGYKYQGAN